jgi:hypothetical protein
MLGWRRRQRGDCVISGASPGILASVVIEELSGLSQSESSNEAFEGCHTFSRREGRAGAECP